MTSRKLLPELSDRLVNFKISDALMPEPADILSEIHIDDVLQGRVLDVSEAGHAGEAFVVVMVEGMSRNVVVPISRLLGVF